MQTVKEYLPEEELALYKEMLGAQTQSMFLMDKTKKIIGIFNGTPEMLAGFAVEEVVGNSILKYANDPESPLCQVCSILNSAFDSVFETGLPSTFQCMILDTYLEATVIKLSGERILSQARDVSDIVLAQKRIEQKKRNELSVALIAGGLSSWSYDVEAQEISSSHENNVIFGNMSITELLKLVSASHVSLVTQMFDDLIAGRCKLANITVSVRNREGGIQWTDVHAVPNEYSSDGKVTQIIGSQKDVTKEHEHNEKLKQLVNELAEAKEKAEQSDNLKSAFLANMSHEIRTPLNSIVGFSQLLPDVETEEEQVSYIDIINANAQVLLNLINDILDLSKIEAGYFTCNDAIFDLSKLFFELNLTFEKKVREGVTLICDIPETEFLVKLDTVRVSQVVSNFITNAIKFTNQGYIKIGLVPMKTSVKLYVEDTGSGMDKEQAARVFDRFEKLDSFEQGTGLGTSIAKAIVDAYDGQIGVESTPGVGSTFWAVLPTNMSDSERTQSRKKMEEERITIAVEQLRELAACHILVAEDNDSNYKLIEQLLKGYTLNRAVNGVEALAMARQSTFDLILMDIRMPLMDGVEAIRCIREFNTAIPIVALTANAFEDDKKRALEVGANAFLTKPVNKKSLIDTIRKYCIS